MKDLRLLVVALVGVSIIISYALLSVHYMIISILGILFIVLGSFAYYDDLISRGA